MSKNKKFSANFEILDGNLKRELDELFQFDLGEFENDEDINALLEELQIGANDYYEYAKNRRGSTEDTLYGESTKMLSILKNTKKKIIAKVADKKSKKNAEAKANKNDAREDKKLTLNYWSVGIAIFALIVSGVSALFTIRKTIEASELKNELISIRADVGRLENRLTSNSSEMAAMREKLASKADEPEAQPVSKLPKSKKKAAHK
jgi:hypothetical protein